MRGKGPVKLRHAAALVMCGWYLLAPPIMSDPEPSGPQNDAELPAHM